MSNHLNPLLSKKKLGFTLIEVLVVTSLTVIVMLGTVTLFMTFLINQVKVTQQQQLKNAGENALKQITQVLREARKIEPCAENMQSLIFFDPSNYEGEYLINNNRIASNSGTATMYLTPELMRASGFLASCYGEAGGQFVRVQFTLEKETSALGSNTASQDFRVSLSLRN